MAEQATLLLLHFKLDERDARQAAQLVNAIQQELNQLNRTEATSARVADTLENAVRSQNRALRETVDAYDDAAAAAHRYDAAADKASQPRAMPSGLEAVDRFGMLGSQIAGGLGASGTVGNAAGLLGDIAGGLSTFGVAGGIAVAATTGLTLVVSELARQSEEAKTKAQEYLAAREAVDQLVLSGATSEDIRALDAENQAALERFQRRHADLQAIQARLDEAQALVAERQDAMLNPVTRYDEAGNPLQSDSEAALQAYLEAQAQEAAVLQEASDLTGERITREQELTAILEGSSSKIDELTTQHLRYVGMLDDEGIALNDAAAALKAQQAEVDATTKLIAQTYLEADRMTAEQRAARVQALEEERAALMRAAETEGISADYAKELETRIGDLGVQLDTFGQITESTADRLAAAAARQQALSEQTDAYFDALEREVSLRQKLFEANEDLTETVERDTEKRLEIAANAADRVRDIEERSADAREKIERDYANNRFDAIAERDTLALFQAKRQAADQETERKKNADRSMQQLGRQLNQQIAAQDTAARREIALRQAAIQRIEVDIVNAENQKIAIAQSSSAQREIMEYRHYENLYRNADFWLSAIESRAARTGTAGRVGAGGAILAPPFAEGGIVTRSGLAMLHAPEVVIPLRPAGRQALPAGGVTININGTGMSRNQIRREVDARLTQYFDEAGY